MSDIKMRGPKDCADSLSYDGQSYAADKKGVFTVPAEACEILQAQGFTAIGDPLPDVVAGAVTP